MKVKRILGSAVEAKKRVVDLAVRAWESPIPVKGGAGVLVGAAVLGAVVFRHHAHEEAK
jgi:hypothetical protein